MGKHPEWPWVARNVDHKVVRAMVNELLHFDKPSGSFKIVDVSDHEQAGRRRTEYEADKDRYSVYFDDYSCGLLQAAWEGWDPEPNYNCGHKKYANTEHCIQINCWNDYAHQELNRGT